MKNIESVLNKSNETLTKKPNRPESQQNQKLGNTQGGNTQKKGGANSKQQLQNQELGKDVKDIKTHEWYQMYGDISSKLESQLEENKKIQEDLARRQDRYQKRELEYRKHIEDLQRELRVRYGYETDAYQKNEKIIGALKKQLDDNIDGIQPKTKKLKEEQEKDIVRKFNSELSKMKKKIEERKTQKGDQAADLKDRENELHHHLELITNIAQRIDNENRALMKKNQELKHEYKTQEDDRELLVKQLVMQKKENAKIREEIEFYERIIEEKAEDVDDEENIDIDKIDTASHAYNGMQSKMSGKRDMSAVNKNQNQRSQLNTRGTNRSQSNANQIPQQTQQTGPLVYIPQKKVESEEEKVKRYERVIEKLKKMLDHERKSLRMGRLQYQREMQSKTELEHLLRETVEQVRQERKNQKKSQSMGGVKFINSVGGQNDNEDLSDLTQSERERVIELLLSQERVIALLYEKTFPMTSADTNKMNYGEGIPTGGQNQMSQGSSQQLHEIQNNQDDEDEDDQ
ncbi:UNKNOWN [Stylonychia lemnae]|uniref:Uncharacterized protein n=1 Tax=Stylonychia lemnae TaxID=5949 RepID=A0A078A1X7_STYLE|nr:UNKNOWN [Stylonychia lemnae]|eukprot:CDW74794.1 UNKNOWN [Stylonychia lemnae]